MAFVGPKLRFRVTGVARELEAGIKKPLAKAKAARLRFQKKQTEFGHAERTRLNTEDRSEPSLAGGGDKGAFGSRVMLALKRGQDFSDQDFETGIEALMFRVEFPMPLDEPAYVTDGKITQLHWRRVDDQTSTPADPEAPAPPPAQPPAWTLPAPLPFRHWQGAPRW